MVRNATLNDLDIVFEFICDLEKCKLDYNAFRTIFDKNVNNLNNIYLLASIDNKTVGFISCHSQDLLHHCGRVGEIQEFYVKNDYRNKGIGRLLVNEIVKIAQFNDFKTLEVCSNILRIENIDIYQHFGFKLTHNKFTMIF